MRRDKIWELPPGYDFQTYEKWFLEFSQGFLHGTEADTSNIQLKINHSLRVLGFARHITEDLAPGAELAELAHLAALFHDVGRFPQYARYKTFHDKLSVNHASQGVLTLKEHQVLAAFAPEVRRLILGVVALHNRRFLPPNLPPAVRFLTQIVRDADKLDIFAVMLAHFNPGQPHNNVVSLELQPHPDNFTPGILAKVQSRQMVNYQDMVWVNDFKLLLCSWVYDLNYGVSRTIARERGYVEELLGYLPRAPEFLRLEEQLRQDLQAGGRDEPGGASGRKP